MKRLLASSLLTLGLAGFSTGGETAARVSLPADATVHCCYLGVSTSLASSMLREQLNLPPGVGIVIDDIDPDSPASLAGLRANDVIEKLNDQWVINVQQFSVLVRMQKPIEPVRLTVIRHGRPTEIKATLCEKALPVLEDAPGWLRGGQPPVPRPGNGRITGMVTHSDNQTTITLVFREDDRQVLIRDRNSGKTLFEGPLNTPDDSAKLPTDLREKVERVEQSSDQHFRELRSQGAVRAGDTPTTGE